MTKSKYVIQVFTYVLIFCIFMGSNFLKFTIGGTNWNVARVMLLISSAIVLIDIIRSLFQKEGRVKIKNRSIKYCIIFFTIWAIWSVMSIFRSLDIKMYLVTNFFICTGVLNTLFLLKYLSIEKNKNIIFNLIIIPVMVNCLYYLYLYFVKKDNIGGFYHNSNDLATVLMLAIPMVLYMIFSKKELKYKVLYIIALIIYSISFINIMSRGCVLGVIFTLIVFCGIIALKFRENILKSKKIKVCLMIAVIIFVLLGGYIIVRYVGEIDLKPIENAQTSNEVRINLIYNGLYFLGQGANGIFGIGSGNNIYYLKNFSIYTTNEIYNFHNFWLDILVEYGVIICIAFIIAYILLCKELYKKSGERFFGKINIIFLFFLIAFIIGGISSSTILTREWLWLVWGMTIAYINGEEEQK